MIEEKQYKNEIVNYYNNTELDYKVIWDLKHSQALHYGYWDKEATTYRKALVRENEILADKVNIKNTNLVLDAGCGVGGSSIFLAKKYGCKVIGITLSEKQKEIATKNAARCRVSELVEFRVMDFENMTFQKETFDVVWAIESICHANSKKSFLENAFRVLRAGGQLIVADFFAVKDSYPPKDRFILEKWLSGWSVNFIEYKENFIKFAEITGFEEISFSNVTQNIVPSSKYLYKMFFPAIFIGKIFKFFGLVNKYQIRNIWAAYYQYRALKKNLWLYGIFHAKK